MATLPPPATPDKSMPFSSPVQEGVLSPAPASPELATPTRKPLGMITRAANENMQDTENNFFMAVGMCAPVKACASMKMCAPNKFELEPEESAVQETPVQSPVRVGSPVLGILVEESSSPIVGFLKSQPAWLQTLLAFVLCFNAEALQPKPLPPPRRKHAKPKSLSP